MQHLLPTITKAWTGLSHSDHTTSVLILLSTGAFCGSSYCAAKAAVRALADSLRLEVRPASCY